jgi:8-oxo-dGTP diphosphatase
MLYFLNAWASQFQCQVSLSEFILLVGGSMSLQTIEPIAYHRYRNHFTASAVVIAMNHILLVHHKRIGAWLPPGGHIEEGEMPHEAAVREVFEETAVSVQVLSEPMPATGSREFLFLPQPMCVHAVLAVEDGQELYHLDLCYVCQPRQLGKSLPSVVSPLEVHGAGWFALDALDKLSLARNVIEVVALAKSRLNLKD